MTRRYRAEVGKLVRRLVTPGHRLDVSERKLNGNFGILEKLIPGGSLSEFLIDSFQARDLVKKENFTSLLYWLGITTITFVNNPAPGGHVALHRLDFVFKGGDCLMAEEV